MYILHIWHRSVGTQRIALRVMLHRISTFRLDLILDLSECHLCMLSLPLSKSDNRDLQLQQNTFGLKRSIISARRSML